MRPALLALPLLTLAGAATAAPMVVIAARGGGVSVGQRIDSAARLSLKAGEQVTLIGADGRSVVQRGPYAGVAGPQVAAAGGGRQALAALISAQTARSSAVGVVRSGGEGAVPPSPGLIDISRGGARCLAAGAPMRWWRPEATAAEPFTILPVDRSWRADFRWAAGQREMAAPPLGRIEGATRLVVRGRDGDERMILIHRAPATLDTDLLLAGWMIEKGCGPQAQALAAAGPAE